MRQILIIMAAMLMSCCSKENEIVAQDNFEAGKHIAMIVSSASSGISGVVADAKRLVPDAVWMGDALSIKDSNRSNASTLIQNWLGTLNFDKEQTAVNDIPGISDKTEFYSLSGFKVEHPSNGIYIRNGKKVAL